MKWPCWITLYIRTHCVARGLRPLTLAAYEDALKQFREWVRLACSDRAPDQVSARDVLEYLQHLRQDRGNADSAVNRALVVLRSFGKFYGLAGLRLGFAIAGPRTAARLADLLGHKIDVRSRLGAGSVFTIEVPLGRAHVADAGPRPAVRSGSATP